MIILETARLTLRTYEADDEEELLDIILSNKALLDAIPFKWVNNINNIYQARSYIKKTRLGALLRSIYTLGIWIKDKNKLIGEISLFNTNWGTDAMEMGYFLDRHYQGKGLTSEAIQTCLGFFFEHRPIDQIVALIHKDNNASQKVVIKCNFLISDIKIEDYLLFYITRETIVK